MSMLSDVTKQALDLPIEERIILVQRVWDSMGHFVSPEVEKAWRTRLTGDGRRLRREKYSAYQRTK